MPPSSDNFAEPRLCTNDLVERYSVNSDTIRKWFREGFLSGMTIHQRWSTTWDEVFAFEGRFAVPRGQAREEAKRPLWTVEMVAERYGKEPATVRGWFRSGKLAASKIMDQWYTDHISLRDFEAQLIH